MMFAFLIFAQTVEPAGQQLVTFGHSVSAPVAVIAVPPAPGTPTYVVNAVGPPPPPGPIIVSPAKETRPPQSYVSAGDYPPSAIAGVSKARCGWT